MKRLVTAVTAILVVMALAASGCSNKTLVGPSPESGQEIVSSCITCHTDKDTLKEVASPEPEAAASEETSGEG
jgi:cytochrome c553